MSSSLFTKCWWPMAVSSSLSTLANVIRRVVSYQHQLYPPIRKTHLLLSSQIIIQEKREKRLRSFGNARHWSANDVTKRKRTTATDSGCTLTRIKPG
jgi:wobble nucleotide-excising tRNase